MMAAAGYLRWFKDLRPDDVPLVGGRNGSLGEIYRELSTQGVHVPNGFALTVRVYPELRDRCVRLRRTRPGHVGNAAVGSRGGAPQRPKVGICGEAPANYPDVAQFLADIGIDSISVNPSSLLRTIGVVNAAESRKAVV